MTCKEGAPTTCWGPAHNYFMVSSHVPTLLRCVIGGLLYTVQMFSCAISWLFFKWPLSQGMAGQHMETSALTIFLSKQQMALLLSFWSGTKIPMAEVLVYIDAAWQGTAWGFASPNSSTAYRCFLCNSHFFSLFLPVTLLLQSVLNFDSSSCDCCVITLLISIMVPRFPPICHLLGSTIVVKDETVELSIWVTSVFGHLICMCHRLNKVIWEIAEVLFSRCFLRQTRPS